MVAYLSSSNVRPQPEGSVFTAAKAMGPAQRQDLALHALAGTDTISHLACQLDVSRKFVCQQAAKAEEALDAAFSPADSAESEILFHLPVTKDWLRQVVLGLTLTCHSSFRGVVEFFGDMLNYSISVGTVHAILQQAVEQARPHNIRQDLSGVRIGAHDEIFQGGRPVLVGADVDSTYCYLLSIEDHRDAETWGIRLLELQDQGFAPEATIGDAGLGLRAGQALAMPGVTCRGDVFHAEQPFPPLVRFLENRAYEAIATHSKLERQMARRQWRGQRAQGLGHKLSFARRAEAQATALAADVALLGDWLRHDILALAGPDYPTRCALYDFVVAELRAREPLCPHRIGPIVRALANQRDDLLAFAAQLDRDLATLAGQFQLPVATLRALFNLQTIDPQHPARGPREAAFRQQLGRQFFAVSKTLDELARLTVRASSVIENLNSRLRTYFFLRRHLGADYLALLQFFLNHRRFPRSDRPERVGKTPAELLTGEAHPHWLEMLGYTRFSRN